MSITIKEIAEKANVSRGTVDRVINNRGNVNKEVEEKIRLIINELNYSPNRAGKGLAARKKPIKIGCLVPSVDNRFFEKVLLGFEKAQNDFSDFGVIIVQKLIKGYSPEIHIKAIDDLVNEGITALCIVTVDDKLISDKIDKLVKSGIPVITVNSDISDCNRMCYVGCNYFNSGETAAGLIHLITKGSANILIVSGSSNMQGHQQRINGFLSSIKARNNLCSVSSIFECLDDEKIAYDHTVQILKDKPQINAIYISAGGVSGVCKAVESLGRYKEMCIICHDDPPVTRELVKCGMVKATICQQPYDQGYKPIKILVDYLINNVSPEKDNYYTSNVIKIKENI